VGERTEQRLLVAREQIGHSGFPSSLVLTTTVFTKRPIIDSRSGWTRPATGMPMTMSVSSL